MEQQILLIEDDSALGRGVAVALTEPGRIVALARDLQQARQRWEQQSFDLVVLDLNLPDGNGLDFLRWLRQRSQVPVLILTANDLESDEVAGLTLGADDYVTKPFSLAVLRARVSNLLRRSARLAAELADVVSGGAAGYQRQIHRRAAAPQRPAAGRLHRPAVCF